MERILVIDGESSPAAVRGTPKSKTHYVYFSHVRVAYGSILGVLRLGGDHCYSRFENDSPKHSPVL